MNVATRLDKRQLDTVYQSAIEARGSGFLSRYVRSLGLTATELSAPVVRLPDEWQHTIYPTTSRQMARYGELPLLFTVRSIDSEVLLQVQRINPLTGESIEGSFSTITSLRPTDTVGTLSSWTDYPAYGRGDVSLGVRRLQAQIGVELGEASTAGILEEILPVSFA